MANNEEFDLYLRSVQQQDREIWLSYSRMTKAQLYAPIDEKRARQHFRQLWIEHKKDTRALRESVKRNENSDNIELRMFYWNDFAPRTVRERRHWRRYLRGRFGFSAARYRALRSWRSPRNVYEMGVFTHAILSYVLASVMHKAMSRAIRQAQQHGQDPIPLVNEAIVRVRESTPLISLVGMAYLPHQSQRDAALHSATAWARTEINLEVNQRLRRALEENEVVEINGEKDTRDDRLYARLGGSLIEAWKSLKTGDHLDSIATKIAWLLEKDVLNKLGPGDPAEQYGSWDNDVYGKNTPPHSRVDLNGLLHRNELDGSDDTITLNELLEDKASAAEFTALLESNNAEILSVLHHVIPTKAKRVRQVAELYFIHGKEIEEIAASLGVSKNVVSVSLHNASKYLKDNRDYVLDAMSAY